MKASEWIDRVKAVKHWDSDYRVAKELGFSRNTIAMYRTKTPTMDEDTSIKVAAALGMNPAGIIVDQVAERSKLPEVRAALSKVARELCILCKVALGANLIAPM
jgi:transcriptional regulator with XRE-family HTH domain